MAMEVVIGGRVNLGYGRGRKMLFGVFEIDFKMDNDHSTNQAIHLVFECSETYEEIHLQSLLTRFLYLEKKVLLLFLICKKKSVLIKET